MFESLYVEIEMRGETREGGTRGGAPCVPGKVRSEVGKKVWRRKSG